MLNHSKGDASCRTNSPVAYATDWLRTRRWACGAAKGGEPNARIWFARKAQARNPRLNCCSPNGTHGSVARQRAFQALLSAKDRNDTCLPYTHHGTGLDDEEGHNQMMLAWNAANMRGVFYDRIEHADLAARTNRILQHMLNRTLPLVSLRALVDHCSRHWHHRLPKNLVVNPTFM